MKALTLALTTVAIVLFLSFLLAWPVMWLWNNCLVEAVDGVHELGWLQAWGITILTSFLFKTHNSK